MITQLGIFTLNGVFINFLLPQTNVYNLSNIGTVFSVLSSYQLVFNKSSYYQFNFHFQPSANQSNLIFKIDGNILFVSGRGESNPTSSVSQIHFINENSTLTIENDVLNKSVDSFNWFIKEVQLDSKIINNNITNGTNLSLLGDVQLNSLSQNDVLVYNNSISKWENKNSNNTFKYFQLYTNSLAGSQWQIQVVSN